MNKEGTDLMGISRRTFARGAFGAVLGSQFALPVFAQARPELAAAMSAIRSYGEAHLSYHHLPGMTLGLVNRDGPHQVLSNVWNFGYANPDARAPITPDTLFQIGSISKVMVAAVLHQFAAEGRFRLTDRLSDLLPSVPFPAGNAIQVQHMLDHVAGLPGDAPMFPEGGLWTAYAPGQHWHYSNTAYEILGKLAEHLGRKPLAQLLRERIFLPLGMTRSRGAIIGADRALYAQGYEAADMTAAYARGVQLRPAPWVDVTFGAGSVASTADDMLTFVLALANAAQGRKGLGLSPEQARAFATHAVPSETPDMSYGNGLMHVGGGGRAYLHHTGGMLSFSSSFHVDVASGIGAFASSTITAFAEYRPRQVTRFAVDALTNALIGRPPPAPPPLEAPLQNAASLVGPYSGPAGAFEIRPGSPLTIVADGQSAALQPLDDDLFHTAHPLFRSFSLLLERKGGTVTLASWGPNFYLRQGAGGELPASSVALAKLAGRYVDDNPWYGAARVVERGGKLWLGTETPMTRIGNNLWRVGKESWSPERASFANFIDGRPQTFIFSGEKFIRHDV
jgi:CubicO group peptidase (beta-lactamase class C family)